MYTTIAQTRNINIEASSRLLDTRSTEKRSYQYNKLFYDFISLPILRRSISKQTIISILHYSCLLNEFSDIITIKVLAVGIHTPKLPPKSLLILLIVTETNVWQRHSYSQTQKPFRTKTMEDYLDRRSPHPYTRIRDSRALLRTLFLVDKPRKHHYPRRYHRTIPIPVRCKLYLPHTLGEIKLHLVHPVPKKRPTIKSVF